MPQLPDRQRSGFLQTEVPRQTNPIMDAGAQFDALSKLGGTISNIALDFQDKRNKADEQQFLTNKDTEDLLATKKFMQEQRLNTPEDGAGYTDAVTKFTQDRLAKNIEEAPSESAKLRYQQSAGNFFTRSIIDASAYEQEKKITKMDADMTKNVNAYSSTQIDIPNPIEAQEQMKKFDVAYDGHVGTVYDQATASKLKDQARKTISESTLKGLYNNGKYKDGLALLRDGKDGTQSDFSKALTPKEKDQYVDQFMKRMALDKEMKSSSISKNVSDMTARAIYKLDVPNSSFENMLGTLAAANRAGVISKDVYAEKRDDILSAQKISQTINSMKDQPINALLASKNSVDKMLRDLTPPGQDPITFNAGKKLQFEDRYKKAIDALIETRESDGVEASFRFDKKIEEKMKIGAKDPAAFQEAIDMSFKAQAALGIRADKIRVTTDAQIGEMAEVINRASTNVDVSVRLRDYEKKFGKHFIKALTEASSDEKKAILPEYIAVANLANPKDREDLVALIRDPDAEIKFQANKRGITSEDIKAASSEVLEPMVKAMGAVPPNFGKGFLQASQLQLKQLVASGKTLSEAKTEIKKRYFDNNFDSASSSRGSIMFPRYPENNQKNIEAYVNTYTPSFNNTDYFAGNPEKFKEFGIYPPKDFIDKAKAKNRTPEQAEQEFYSRVRDSAKWVTSKDMDGIMLVTEEEPGKKVPVLDKNENPIIKSLSDISSKPDKHVIERLKSPLQRMFGL